MTNPGNRKIVRYSDEFRDKVIEFARINNNFVTRQHFMIPDSTLRCVCNLEIWTYLIISIYRIWLKQAGLEGRKLSQDKDEAELKEVIAKLPIVDCTHRLPFTKEYRSKVLDHSKRHGLKEAAVKFGVSMEDLKLWTRRAGKKFTRDIPDESKRNIVEWGVKVNCWKLAARRYNIHPSTVGLWARKFNLKLQPGGMETHQDLSAKFEEARKEDTTERTEPTPRLNQQTIIRDENSKTELFDVTPGESDSESAACVKITPPKKIRKEVWKVNNRHQKPFVWRPVIDEIREESFDVPTYAVREVGLPGQLDNHPVSENLLVNDEGEAKGISDPMPEVNVGKGFCDSCQQQLDVGESLYEHFAIYHIV